MDLNSSLIQKDDAPDQQMKSIADLPPEMIQAVLERVPTVDLLNCRQMNRQWNNVSSRIMSGRQDMKLRFCLYQGQFIQTVQYRNCEEMLVDVCKPRYKCVKKRLIDLVACLSGNFPCTNFHFDDLENFAEEDMQMFLSIWGNNIQSLQFNMSDPIKSVGPLKELLFEKVTNLKKLHLQFCKNELYMNFMNKTPSSIKMFNESNKLQLPNLEVFYVDFHYKKFRGIFENIVTAACNLKRFEIRIECKLNPYFGPGTVHEDRIVMEEESITAKDFALLDSLNKLHCLKHLRLFITGKIIEYFQKSTVALSKMKLKSLNLSLDKSIWGNKQQLNGATSIINQMLCSSKDIMETLSIEPLGSLTGLVIPKMKNVKKIDLCGFSQRITSNNAMFPARFEMADAFPNVKELDMHTLRDDVYFPSCEPLKAMASVESLRIFGAKSKKCKDKVMEATPNVTALMVIEDNFPRSHSPIVEIDFKQIASSLPKLESFGWLICRLVYRSLLHKLDAAITGLPEALCKKLATLFRNKHNLNADEVAFYQLQRENASILDLKELKKCDVTLFFDFDIYSNEVSSGNHKVDEAGFAHESEFFETGFSKVSKFLAFDLMQELKVRTHKRME